MKRQILPVEEPSNNRSKSLKSNLAQKQRVTATLLDIPVDLMQNHIFPENICRHSKASLLI